MPVEDRSRIRGAIINVGLEVDCCPIIDWICIGLTLSAGGGKSPLAIPLPTAPLADGDFLRHRRHMLTRHLPGLDPALQRVQGSLITTHIGEVTVDMRNNREVKAVIRQT